MVAQDFMKWAEMTRTRFAVGFSEKIGVSRPVAEGFYRDAKAGRAVHVSRQIALAMSAIAHGLDPWAEPKGENDDDED